MKFTHAIRVMAAACVFSASVPSLAGQERHTELFNFDWRFCRGELPGAESVGYDDSGWELVQLPHDASIYGPFVRDTLGGDRANGYRPRTRGWYRKHFTVDSLVRGRRYILEFEGVYRAARLWVNGEYQGQWLNGYLDFERDITSALRPGDNLVAVHYDNRYRESSRWYTGRRPGVHPILCAARLRRACQVRENSASARRRAALVSGLQKAASTAAS